MKMTDSDPESKVREVIDACADCDCCRPPMDPPCDVFAELYRLWDREQESGEPTAAAALRRMADLCNFCALCPCPNIRADLIEAKTRFAARDGLSRGARLLQDVERLARTCGMFPKAFNRLVAGGITGGLLKRAAGIHPGSRLPEFPAESFDRWAAAENLREPAKDGAERKIAYFAGCTARFLFPEVPRAATRVLRQSGVHVHYPGQRCCGMPPFLEGDRNLALELARENIDRLAGLVGDGYDIVCTCPTCTFMLRRVIAEGACYSTRYQEAVGGDEQNIVLPAYVNGRGNEPVKLSKRLYGSILKDEGYFSSIDPVARSRVAQNTWDLGEYLLDLHEAGVLSMPAANRRKRLVYFAPCHQREQEIGTPYAELLRRVAGGRLETIDGRFYCCGMAGIMGFKADFRDASVRMGLPLMEKIREKDPDALVTDCLSCRLQFRQHLSYPVHHPIEILAGGQLPVKRH
jgi:glycerol-3-phosphate dehydrogenase subunit C